MAFGGPATKPLSLLQHVFVVGSKVFFWTGLPSRLVSIAASARALITLGPRSYGAVGIIGSEREAAT
jgi:hypothetical protein